MQNRINAIQNVLNPQEAILVTSEANRFYLTGFPSSAGVLLITANTACFYIDFRYYEKAKHIVRHCETVLMDRLPHQLQQAAQEENIATIYVETSFMTLERYRFFSQILPACRFSDDPAVNDLILRLRSVKTPEEAASIRRAQAITDDTFRYILQRISPGRTEREIMLDMEFYLRKQGSEGVSFDFIVVSGPNSSLPHGVPTERKIQSGDFITMDFGAVVNGYRSDMTRTVAVGAITEEQRAVYNTVLEAQNQAFSVIAPGRICKDVDAAARSYIDECGYENCFGHGLGHSVGIEIHENPCFNTTDETPLSAGMVLTVEPGIYLEGRFGVRIEDMVWITETGFENLTGSSKELIIL